MIPLIIVASLLTFAFLGCLICYRKAFYSPVKGQNDMRSVPSGEQYLAIRDKMLEGVDALAALPFEWVHIVSRDGLRLAGRYYHVGDGAPLAICFHGYRATAVRDFSGGARFLMENGQNVLLVDQRAQGLSEGHTMTFGAKERFDCIDWIGYAISRFGSNTPVYLYGVSMGAATVLMAAGLPLPANVRAVIADSPYSSAEAIIKKVCRDMRLPVAIAYPLLRLGAKVFGRFDIEDADALASVGRANLPILIIHGEDDRFVPCRMSACLKAANPAIIRLETFPGAGHGISYMTNPERYREITAAMMR